MRWPIFLTVIVASLMVSGASCRTPTAPPSPILPPASCLEHCAQYLPPLPRVMNNNGRLLWEYRAMREYAACAALHNLCVDENTRRVNSDRISQ